VSTSTDHLQDALSGQYGIQREIGSGGMALVYLAEDLKHRRQVAIKVLKPELSATIGGERFLREIEIAARLSHPHILPLFDSGAAGDLLYYVMPFIPGESLRSRLVRERQLPVDDALRLTREVASAIGFAHQHGIVHRDIKPENILLADGIALVADFGIARAVRSSRDNGGHGQTALTAIGLALGTPTYMSPEQFTADDVDARSDIYSLGCVLFEMLAGTAAVHGLARSVAAHAPHKRATATERTAADGVTDRRAHRRPGAGEGSRRSFCDRGFFCRGHCHGGEWRRPHARRR
jgi:serine/threonine protein kinase